MPYQIDVSLTAPMQCRGIVLDVLFDMLCVESGEEFETEGINTPLCNPNLTVKEFDPIAMDEGILPNHVKSLCILIYFSPILFFTRICGRDSNKL